MMDKNNKKWDSMSDTAIVNALGSFIKQHRLEQNKTQTQLAKDAGINRTTLALFEKGKRGNIITLIQLLRALNLLSVFETFELQQQLSPLQLAALDRAKRKRASKGKPVTKPPKSDW